MGKANKKFRGRRGGQSKTKTERVEENMKRLVPDNAVEELGINIYALESEDIRTNNYKITTDSLAPYLQKNGGGFYVSHSIRTGRYCRPVPPEYPILRTIEDQMKR